MTDNEKTEDGAFRGRMTVGTTEIEYDTRTAFPPTEMFILSANDLLTIIEKAAKEEKTEDGRRVLHLLWDVLGDLALRAYVIPTYAYGDNWHEERGTPIGYASRAMRLKHARHIAQSDTPDNDVYYERTKASLIRSFGQSLMDIQNDNTLSDVEKKRLYTERKAEFERVIEIHAEWLRAQDERRKQRLANDDNGNYTDSKNGTG